MWHTEQSDEVAAGHPRVQAVRARWILASFLVTSILSSPVVRADVESVSVPPAHELLERWRAARERINTLVVDGEIVSYTTFAYVSAAGSRLSMDVLPADVAEIVELVRDEWIEGTIRRLRFEADGDRFRLDLSTTFPWTKEYGALQGTQMHLTSIFDGVNTRELSVGGAVDAGPRGRIFKGKPQAFLPYDLCFTGRGHDLLVSSLEDDYHIVEGADRPEQVDGRETYRLALRSKLQHGATHWAVWLDPASGYIPRRIELYALDDTEACRAQGDCPTGFINIYENIEITEVGPGIWFPTGAEVTGLVPSRKEPDQLVMTTKRYITLDVNALRVNVPLPQGLFEEEWPAGALVIDQVGRRGYQVGEGAEKVVEVELAKVREQARLDKTVDLFEARRGAEQVVPVTKSAAESVGPAPARGKSFAWFWVTGLAGAACGLVFSLAIMQRLRGN